MENIPESRFMFNINLDDKRLPKSDVGARDIPESRFMFNINLDDKRLPKSDGIAPGQADQVWRF
jgi:hypothetical protein